MAAVRDLATLDVQSVRFAYPSNWSPEIEHSDGGASVGLQSAGVSFAIVSVFPDDVDPDDLLHEALDSLRQSYSGIEVDELDDDMTGDGVGVEATFFSLDFITCCWLRSWRVGSQSVLVMLQSIEPEFPKCRPVFRAICQSIEPAS